MNHFGDHDDHWFQDRDQFYHNDGPRSMYHDEARAGRGYPRFGPPMGDNRADNPFFMDNCHDEFDNMRRPPIDPMHGPPFNHMNRPPYDRMGGPPYDRMDGPPYDRMSGPPYDRMGGPPYDRMRGPPFGDMHGPPFGDRHGPPFGDRHGPPFSDMHGPPNDHDIPGPMRRENSDTWQHRNRKTQEVPDYWRLLDSKDGTVHGAERTDVGTQEEQETDLYTKGEKETNVYTQEEKEGNLYARGEKETEEQLEDGNKKQQFGHKEIKNINDGDRTETIPEDAKITENAEENEKAGNNESADASDEDEDEKTKAINKLPAQHTRGLMSTLIGLAGPEIQNKKPDPLPLVCLKKEVDQTPKQGTAVLSEATFLENGITPDMLEEANTEVDYDEDIMPEDIGRPTDKVEFYCKLCDKQTTSIGNFRDHLNGRGHKSAMEAARLGRKPTGNKKKQAVKAIADVGKKSVCLDLLEDVTAPILGLSFVTEFHSTTGVVCVCNLCAVKFDYNIAVSHLSGTKHRLRYMKDKRPAVYAHLKTFGGKKSKLTEFLNDLSIEVEQEDGRGFPVIKMYEPEKNRKEDPDTTKDLENSLMINEALVKELVGEKEMGAFEFQTWVNEEVNKSKQKYEEQKRAKSPSKTFGNGRTMDLLRSEMRRSPSNPPSGRDRLYAIEPANSALPLLPQRQFPPYSNQDLYPPPFNQRNSDLDQLYPRGRFDPYPPTRLLPRAEHNYLADPLSRKPEPYLDPDPVKRLQMLNSAFNSDPAKKALPSNDVSVNKPVLFDYGHDSRNSDIVSYSKKPDTSRADYERDSRDDIARVSQTQTMSRPVYERNSRDDIARVSQTQAMSRPVYERDSRDDVARVSQTQTMSRPVYERDSRDDIARSSQTQTMSRSVYERDSRDDMARVSKTQTMSRPVYGYDDRDDIARVSQTQTMSRPVYERDSRDDMARGSQTQTMSRPVYERDSRDDIARVSQKQAMSRPVYERDSRDDIARGSQKQTMSRADYERDSRGDNASASIQPEKNTEVKWENDIKRIVEKTNQKAVLNSLDLIARSYSLTGNSSSPPKQQPQRKLPFSNSYLDNLALQKRETVTEMKTEQLSVTHTSSEGLIFKSASSHSRSATKSQTSSNYPQVRPDSVPDRLQILNRRKSRSSSSDSVSSDDSKQRRKSPRNSRGLRRPRSPNLSKQRRRPKSPILSQRPKLSSRPRSPKRPSDPRRSRSPNRSGGPRHIRSPKRSSGPRRSRSPTASTSSSEASPVRIVKRQRLIDKTNKELQENTTTDADDDAERIANLLVEISNSMTGTEDPQTALRALFSNPDLARALLASNRSSTEKTAVEANSHSTKRRSSPQMSRLKPKPSNSPATSSQVAIYKHSERSQQLTKPTHENVPSSSKCSISLNIDYSRIAPAAEISSREKVAFSLAGSQRSLGRPGHSSLPIDFASNSDDSASS